MTGRARSAGGPVARVARDTDGARIRRYRPADRDDVYRICLLTGDGGNDATAMYRYPDLLGDVFAGPYLRLQRRFAFVIATATGVEGYVLGALDSATFAAECERVWWPSLRARYARAAVEPGSRDEWLIRRMTAPPPVPAFAERYPSHLHIDLLPRRQSGGWGRRLMDRLLRELAAAGSVGVHLGVGRGNAHAIGFYRHLGFTELDGDATTLWLGRSVAR